MALVCPQHLSTNSAGPQISARQDRGTDAVLAGTVGSHN